MNHGHLARKHVGAVKKCEQDKLTHMHQMEDKLVREMLRKPKFVIPTAAQSTVNGDLMVNGRLAHKAVAEVLEVKQGLN